MDHLQKMNNISRKTARNKKKPNEQNGEEDYGEFF